MKDTRPELKKYLLEWINMNDSKWHKKVDLYVVGDQIEFSAESVGRTLRILFKEGKIQRELYNGKWVKGLCKYASLGVEKPIINKPKIIENDDGTRTVFI